MYTTYHLDSAQDINNDIINSIKAAFKTKPIKIIITEDEQNDSLDKDLIASLEDRLTTEDKDFISAEESIIYLNKKYGI